MLRVPDPNVMIARECEPLPVELVMRAYLTGVTSTSIWKAYEAGARTFCGHALPEGMKKNQRLPQADPDAVDEGREGRPRRLGVASDELLAMGRIEPERVRSRGRASPRRCSRRARRTPRSRA